MDRTSADPVAAKILDAALQQFEEVGVRKSTIEDIARRAGVGRMTVYRRFGAKDDILAAVVNRETRHILDQIAHVAGGDGALDDRIVAAFTFVVRYAKNHRLLNRLIALDPESTLSDLTTNASAPLTAAVHAGVWYFGRDIEGSSEATDFPARVEAAVRIIHSIALTPHITIGLTTDEQIAQFARVCIVPILTAGTTYDQDPR